MSNSDVTFGSTTVTKIHPQISNLKTSDYNVSDSDYIVGIGILSNSISITLPLSPNMGDQYIIKDVDGCAGIFPVTINGNGALIDGQSNLIISQNFASYTLVFTSSQWSIVQVYAGQQNGNGFGLYSNRPAQGQSGRTYYGTDTSMMYYDDGYNWNPIGQTDICTALKSADFTWQNQNGATATDFGSSIYLYAPNNVGAQNLRFFYQNVPSTPYTITAKFIHLGGFINGTASLAAFYALAWGDGTKLTTLHVNTGDSCYDLNVANWDDVSTFNANVYSDNDVAIANQLSWLRISDDGVNRSCSISRDGINFLTIYSTPNSDFLTPTRVGIVLDPFQGDQHTSVVSWKIS